MDRYIFMNEEDDDFRGHLYQLELHIIGNFDNIKADIIELEQLIYQNKNINIYEFGISEVNSNKILIYFENVYAQIHCEIGYDLIELCKIISLKYINYHLKGIFRYIDDTSCDRFSDEEIKITSKKGSSDCILEDFTDNESYEEFLYL